MPPEPPLPGPALIGLLGELGLSEGAARSAILRMRRAGWLISQRTGRTVAYAPSEQVVAGHRRRADGFTSTGPPWDGSFHALLVSAAENRRAFRDALRRAAHIAGYRRLQAGLLVAASDRRAELGDLLQVIPPGASVVSGRLQLGPEDMRRVAQDLWALVELADRYQALASRATAAAATARSDPRQGSDAFRSFADATLPIYEAIADDPGLPEALLPAHWPGPQLAAALAETLAAFGPALVAHVAHLRHNAATPRQRA